MSTGSDSSVIRKKALNGREDFDARAMSWSKAVRLSLERLSDRLFDLEISVRTVEQVDCSLRDLREVASGDQLIMLLDAYGGLTAAEAQNARAGRGAAILDRGLVQSLVEVQTRGKITQAGLETRAFTSTDAAVAAQLIDPVLSAVDDMMIDSPQSADPLRLRYGDKVEDGRALLLALEAPDYALFRIALDIESGARSGEMVLAIPDEMLRPPPPAFLAEEGDTGEFDLSTLALSAPIALNAVVARLTLPLSRISTLKPGDVLPVERRALTRTELLGSKGFVLGRVTLGQMNGVRAVRFGAAERDSAAHIDDLDSADAKTPARSRAVVLPPDEHGPDQADGPAMDGLTDTALGSEVDLDSLLAEAGEVDAADDAMPSDEAELDPLDDLLDLANLDDLSALDDATLKSSDGDGPDLADLPDLPDLPSL